jgi:hypothetical protein
MAGRSTRIRSSSNSSRKLTSAVERARAKRPDRIRTRQPTRSCSRRNTQTDVRGDPHRYLTRPEFRQGGTLGPGAQALVPGKVRKWPVPAVLPLLDCRKDHHLRLGQRQQHAAHLWLKERCLRRFQIHARQGQSSPEDWDALIGSMHGIGRRLIRDQPISGPSPAFRHHSEPRRIRPRSCRYRRCARAPGPAH